MTNYVEMRCDFLRPWKTKNADGVNVCFCVSDISLPLMVFMFRKIRMSAFIALLDSLQIVFGAQEIFLDIKGRKKWLGSGALFCKVLWLASASCYSAVWELSRQAKCSLHQRPPTAKCHKAKQGQQTDNHEQNQAEHDARCEAGRVSPAVRAACRARRDFPSAVRA